jgi:hypothetical protein
MRPDRWFTGPLRRTLGGRVVLAETAAAGCGPWGDGVDDLPVGERVAVARVRRVVRTPRHSPQARRSAVADQLLQVSCTCPLGATTPATTVVST